MVTDENDWETWLQYILAAVESTSLETIAKVQAIKALFAETVALVKERLPRIYSKELVEILFFQPYCKIFWKAKKWARKCFF